MADSDQYDDTILGTLIAGLIGAMALATLIILIRRYRRKRVSEKHNASDLELHKAVSNLETESQTTKGVQREEPSTVNPSLLHKSKRSANSENESDNALIGDKVFPPIYPICGVLIAEQVYGPI
jgi:hypothetical protein